MKISEFGPIKSADSVKKRTKTSSTSSFSDFLATASADDAAPAAQLSDVASAASIDNMLALQEVSEEEGKRKKLQQQGNTMLESLERLRRQLLTGEIPVHTIHDLSRQLSVQRETVSDPALISIIDDIELRVAVEMAKLDKARRDQQE